MVTSEPADLEKARAPRAYWFFLAGFVLFVLGPAAYVLRFNTKHLENPWYIPVCATLGLALMVMSLRRYGGVPRTVGLVLFAIVCGFEWFAIGIGSKSPSYQGPAQAGKKVPPFTTKLADGASFTDKDLENGATTALVFYRGHW